MKLIEKYVAKEMFVEFLRDFKRPATLITFGVYVVSALLIMVLVYYVTGFSKRVTDYYAPTIYAVKSFADTVHHLHTHLENDGRVDDATLHLLKEKTEQIKHIIADWDPVYRKHMDYMLLKANDFLDTAERQGAKDELLKKAVELNIISQKYVDMHENELLKAKIGINTSSLRIQMVALFLFFIGIVVSLREMQLHRLKERDRERLSAMKALVSALDARDPYTKGHSTRVADYSMTMGKIMGIGGKTLEHLYLAALMHDIGKIAVPDAVLRKEGPLTGEEWQEIKVHPIVSAKMLQDFESIREIVPWVLYHHERFDGKGYPEGKSGSEIPVYSQIIAICDSFDAMTSSRPYRKGMDLKNAILEIESNRNLQWDTKIVDYFLQCIRGGLIATVD